MTAVPIEKYHGTDNDFVVVDASEVSLSDPEAFAIAHCDRETGVGGERIGADGVLVLELREGDPPRVEMTLFQPDGSTAAMCGNGARCTAAWAARRSGARTVVIETPAGDRRAVVHDDSVTVEMGRPSFDPADVPLARAEPLVEEDVAGLTVTAVDTGVPHAVAFVDDVDAVGLETVAPPVRHAEIFPEGTNVTFATLEGDAFRQRTFERGVEGETRACGTGAVAIVAVAKRIGLFEGESPVRVSPPGGDLLIVVPDDPGEPATLTGPVVREFAGELPAPDVQP